jgi:tyrosine-protein kinase
MLRPSAPIRIMATSKQEDQVSLSEFLRVLRDRWRVVCVGMLLGVWVAAVITWSTTPSYASTVVMFVSAQEQQGDASGAYQGSLMSQQKVKSYVELLMSGRLREEVAHRTGMTVAPDAITASTKPDTVLLTATATDPSPARARRLADAVGKVFPALIAELEQPADGTPPNVVVRIVEPAGLPDSPVAPRPVVNLVLGALLGVVAGLLGAIARNATDNTVKSAQAMEDLIGAPSLGTVAYSPDVATRPLIVHEPAGTPRAESYRHIRTNLQFVDVDHPPRVVVVSSPLPSEGKTTTTCNLAIALAQSGNRVAVVDADLRRPQIADLLGLEGAAGLTSVLIGEARLEDVLQSWGREGVAVLTSGPVPPNPSELLTTQHMAKVLDELSQSFDFVLIDTPPLLPVTDAALLAGRYDGALLVVRHGRTTRSQVKAAMAALSAVSANVLGAVLTMTPKSTGKRDTDYYHYSYVSTPPRPRDSLPWWRLPLRRYSDGGVARTERPHVGVAAGGTPARKRNER